MAKNDKEYLDKTYDMFRKHWIETNNFEESWERTKRLLHWYRIGLKDGVAEQRKIDIDKACEWLAYKLMPTMDEAVKNGNAIEHIINTFKKELEEER